MKKAPLYTFLILFIFIFLFTKNIVFADPSAESDGTIQETSPKISVIIPVYNSESYLRQCFDSTLNQTLSDIEIICVNDASPDDSLKILRKYEEKDKRVTVIDKKSTRERIWRVIQAWP